MEDESKQKDALKPEPQSEGVLDSFNLELGLKVEVSQDSLKAKLIARPNWLIGKEITMSEISMILENCNLSNERVDFEAFGPILNEINTRLRNKKNLDEVLSFPIAEGIPAQKGIDGWVKFFFPRARKVKIREDGSADYRNIDRYVHVNKDDRLATLFEGIPGKSGIDVYGKPIPAPSITRAKLEIGSNIRKEDRPNPENELMTLHVFYANCNGVIYTTDNSITVSPELNIESDVGLETGNINFDGTVNVQGNIIEGSVVDCKGSLFVSGNVESMDVFVQDSLDVKGGVKGKDKSKGVIRVNGDLKAKFIENANIEVEGDIVVENNILNSKIKCLGSIFLSSDNSSVVTSDLIVYQGISTANLGSNAELDTKIEVGFHFKNDRLYQEGKTKYANFEMGIKEMEPKILKIKDIVTRSRGKLDEARKVEFKAIFEDYSKRKKVSQILAQKIEALKISRYSPENVKVVVRNVAHPGTILRYRKQIEKISKPQTSFMYNFFPFQEKAQPTAWKKNP